MAYSVSTNGKTIQVGDLYDGSGNVLQDSDGHGLKAYIPLPYARVKAGTVVETLANHATFTIEFLDEFGGVYAPANRDATVAIAGDQNRLLFSDYLTGSAAGTITEGEKVQFEELVMNSPEVTATI